MYVCSFVGLYLVWHPIPPPREGQVPRLKCMCDTLTSRFTCTSLLFGHEGPLQGAAAGLEDQAQLLHGHLFMWTFLLQQPPQDKCVAAHSCYHQGVQQPDLWQISSSPEQMSKTSWILWKPCFDVYLWYMLQRLNPAVSKHYVTKRQLLGASFVFLWISTVSDVKL